MRQSLILSGAALLLAALSAPAAAAEKGWHLRAFGAWVDPGVGASLVNDEGTDIRVDGASELGLGAALEYQFNDRFGVEIGALSVSPGIELSAEIPGYGTIALKDSLSTLATTLDVDIHLTSGHPALDFCLGFGWAELSLGDLVFAVPGEAPLALDVRDSSGWTAKVVLDYTFRESGGWGVTAGLRYIDADLEAAPRGDPSGATERFDNDLLVGSFGVAYRF